MVPVYVVDSSNQKRSKIPDLSQLFDHDEITDHRSVFLVVVHAPSPFIHDEFPL